MNRLFPSPFRRARPFWSGSAAGRLLAAALLLACLSAFGCAPKHPAAIPGQPDADAVFAAFKNNRDPGKASWRGFAMNASLSFSAQAKSGRLNIKFWGDPDTPLRLDFTTPVGGAFAFWFEDESGWTAYYPGENAVYTHPDARRGMARLGMPLPFDLRGLAAVTTGRLPDLVPDAYRKAKNAPEGYEYFFNRDAPMASMILDFDGKPIHLTGRGIEPWRIDLSKFTEGPHPEPRLLVLTTPGGAKAKIRVKSLSGRDVPWPLDALVPIVPAGAEPRPLDLPGEYSTPGL